MQAYTGNGAYCYANALHMCLLATGNTGLPDPGFLECLTTMPFGISYTKSAEHVEIYFNAPKIDPVSGLERALDASGWSYTKWTGTKETTAQSAFTHLQKAVKSAPVLVGPLDMSLLAYDPVAAQKRGADHFVVVLAIDDNYVRLHDPQGYPYALLPLATFLEAWRAEEIDYVDVPYTFFTNFQPHHPRSRAEAITHVLPAIKGNILDKPDDADSYAGAEALHLLASDIQQARYPGLAEQLTFFVLPLAARRTLDSAFFWQEAGFSTLATLSQRKAELVGEAQYHIVHASWDRGANLLRRIAEVESQLSDSF
ncbi:MAG TPA: hypothetical protein VL485_03055 [Ktedonobacteraceae bacterium]|jgi:hypothetical protein|nr:hypothetical protein [Ktedonobacteraceae bacterium]